MPMKFYVHRHLVYKWWASHFVRPVFSFGFSPFLIFKNYLSLFTKPRNQVYSVQNKRIVFKKAVRYARIYAGLCHWLQIRAYRTVEMSF